MKESRSDAAFSAVMTGIMIVFALIALIPLLNILSLSLSSKVAVEMNSVNLLPVGTTLDSWKFIAGNGDIWRSFAITLFSTAAGVVLAVILNALMAYPLSKTYFAPGKIIMMLVVGTMIFKAPIVPYFLTVRGYGLYNNVLVLIVPHILSAYNMAIMRTFFKQFPAEVEEAACIDGCGMFGTLMKIVLPSSKAVLATESLFYGLTIWNQFQHPMMFISKVELYPLQLKIRQLINAGGDLSSMVVRANVNYNETTLGAAAVVFAIIPIIAIYPWVQKYFAKGAMLGSVKG
ncbi:MAG: carbohydrate ABC transporter permease [Clostridia bacterium]|nr:carbohydrate ABC transporter permease [Clostridia bacterium]